MKTLLTSVLALALVCPAIAATYDVGYGTITASEIFKHAGTTDSFMGTLTRKSDGFTISFDIGKMAGTHMHDGKKEKCTFFRKHSIGALPATTGIEDVPDGPRIVTTVDYDPETRRDPANFSAVIRNDSEVADFLLIVTTYNANHILSTKVFDAPKKLFPTSSSRSDFINAQPILEEQGIAFPPGSSALHYPASQIVIVRNSQANLDLVQALIRAARSGNP
jgi:hypothetical protein